MGDEDRNRDASLKNIDEAPESNITLNELEEFVFFELTAIWHAIMLKISFWVVSLWSTVKSR